MNKRLIIVFILGFSSGIPLSLITSTLQAWFAISGMSVLATGILSLISLPYILRILWAPFIDQFTLFSSLGNRRSWMLLTQCALLIGFVSMASLRPEQAPMQLAFIAFLLAACSATQDLAIEAQRVEYLPLSQHALGASLAVFSYRLALLVSGGFALILANYIGWPWTYRLLALLMLIGITATLFSDEPQRTISPQAGGLKLFTAPLQDLLQQSNIITLLLFILFYKFGEVFTATTSGIVMPFLIQGLGFSLDTIGYVNKILGVASILLGGLAAGYLLLHWSLYRALMVFGIIQAISNVWFIVLALVGKHTLLLAIAVVCDNFATGMGSTALVALLMRVVKPPYTASQFSLLVAFSTIPRIVSGPFAALLQMKIGWIGLYQFAFLLSLGFIPFLFRIKKQVDEIYFNEAKEQSSKHSMLLAD